MARVRGVIRASNLIRVEIERSRLDIRKYRAGAQRADRAARGNERKRRDDHFIAQAYAAGVQPQFQRFGSGGDADAMVYAAGRRDFLFQRRRLAAPAQIAAWSAHRRRPRESPGAIVSNCARRSSIGIISVEAVGGAFMVGWKAVKGL